MTEIDQLKADVDYLARRASRAGAFICDARRDTGISSNSLVAIAYGTGTQQMPSDWSDYAACVRAVRGLPRHRRTSAVLMALRQARKTVEGRYPREGDGR